jgi:Caspase domain
VLGNAQIGGFSVQVVRNEPSHVIQGQIEDLFSESRPDDVLLLHFSGHGLKSESGELFFAASNTRPNRLGSTAVSADFVQRCMRDARSRSVVLLLDCCYGGAFAQGVTVRAAGDVNVLDSFPQGRSGSGRGRAVITASSAMEYAFEGDRLADDQHQRPSVFTSALVEGLATGDADRDEDGWVSLNELYDYVFDKVREHNPHQTPSRQFDLEGELYLARSGRRRIRPVPIPPDLQAAITDQNIYTRRGAVHELESRLAREDLPVAAGAYEALAELARTDIPYVADLAAAAIDRAAVRPEETELDFGEQRQGSVPPHRLVRLLGPPIARACAPSISHDWIRVTATAEGFDVSVDTSRTGTLSGSIDLKGPTGEAFIAIDVELLPRTAQTSTARTSGLAYQEDRPPTIPAGQPEGGSAATDLQKDREGAEHGAAEKGSQDAIKAVPPQAMESDRTRTSTDHESSAAAQSTAPATPLVRQPSTAPPDVTRAEATGDEHPAHRLRANPRLLAAGTLAVVGTVLAVVGWFLPYVFGSPGFSTVLKPYSVLFLTSGWSSFLVGTAALYLTAGVFTLIPRAAPLLGPGLLLATAAASTSTLVYNVNYLNGAAGFDGRGFDVGFWLQLASNLSLMVAACVVGLALARASEARMVLRPPQSLLPWVVVLLGVAGTLALIFQDFKVLVNGPAWEPQVVASSIAMTFWALVMPAWAALAVPRQLGVVLLAGWIWVGAAFFVYCYLFLGSADMSRGPVTAFGITLLALSAVTFPFAREAPRIMPDMP